MKSIAISIGDSNGIGCEILLRELEWLCYQCGYMENHPSLIAQEELQQEPRHATKHYEIIICAHKSLLEQALALLDSAQHTSIASSTTIHNTSHTTRKKHSAKTLRTTNITALLPLLRFYPPALPPPPIRAGQICAHSGAYSFASVECATKLAQKHQTIAMITLPIHKAAWKQAGVAHAGHTEYFRAHLGREVIMVLGCEEMLVALFCDHIPLASVSARIATEAYHAFLLCLAQNLAFSQALVLGFNPHCGDNGAIGGHEDAQIRAAIESANKTLGKEVFIGPCAPDSAFTPYNQARFNVFVAPYHDIGLAPLKALYFDKSINISLNLPFIRASVDHGVAFDIAYTMRASTQSFREAVRYALKRLESL